MTIHEATSLLDILSFPNLDEALLKTAYRKMARKHHPDMGGSPELFIQIREAYSYLKQVLENPDIDQFTTKTNTKNESETPHPFYKKSEEINEYFLSRIADLEGKNVELRRKWIYDRERLIQYESVFNQQIRLIHTTKNEFETILENWKNQHQYSNDKWAEDIEKVSILHNTGKVNTIHFLAQKDYIEATRETNKKEADQYFQTELINLLDNIFSTFYTLLDF